MGTVVFVHGTGVRLKDYVQSFERAKRIAKAVGIASTFVHCGWGDPLGVEFSGASLPDPPSAEQLHEWQTEFAQWNWLFDDPLFELDKLTIRVSPKVRSSLPPGILPEWERLWRRVSRYEPSAELQLLLARGGLSQLWTESWSKIVDTSAIPKLAFEASAHEPVEASRALARSVIAQLHIDATTAGQPGMSRALRQKLLERLLVDWDQQVYGVGTFLMRGFERAATRMLRTHRASFSDCIALPIGDIVLYQARGSEVRDFIRRKISDASPPVTLIAHSLGGIACVDLLALPNPPPVAHIVTAGSQAPLLYELGALCSLKPSQPLPSSFPPWLNLFDRNDFLSYVGGRLWPQVRDFEIDSGLPFPASHSAYFGNEDAWREIRQFITQ